MVIPSSRLTLAHWRRTIAELYAQVRQAPEAKRAEVWETFRAARDALFISHPDTPLSGLQQTHFTALPYYPYDKAWRVTGQCQALDAPRTVELELGGDGRFRYTCVGRVHFTVQTHTAHLDVFWIEGYGGGLFLPFGDLTNGETTYGGGRYLYDTIKGADLGVDADGLVLDFNYAYNPSCAYHEQWTCPLTPPENRLPFAVEAGEALKHVG